MLWFLTIVLSIYAAMHGYLFWKVWKAFPRLGWGRAAVGAFLLVMVLAPVLVAVLDRRAWARSAGALATVGYLWLAAIFWFCMLAAAVDAWNLAVRAVALAAPAARAAVVGPRAALAGIGGIVVLALCWGWVEASNVRIRNVTVELADPPPGATSLRLVQISDLHLGVHTGRRRLARIVGLIRQARPDVLVCTGDLVDSSGVGGDLSALAGMLAEIDPPLGKFAVLGNHEFYAGVENSLAFHRAAGLRVLRGESVRVGGVLRIAGVDDPAGSRTGAAPRTDESAALSETDPAAVTVLLKHQPRVAAGSAGRFHLQLSGHTHGGQLFPFHLVVALRYPFFRGLHRLPEGSWVYVSPGTGTWGPPLRLLSPPEVTVITFVARRPS